MSAIRSSFIRAAAKAGRRTTPSIISRQAVRAFTTTPQANDYEAIHEKEIPATKFQPGKSIIIPNIKAMWRFQYSIPRSSDPQLSAIFFQTDSPVVSI